MVDSIIFVAVVSAALAVTPLVVCPAAVPSSTSTVHTYNTDSILSLPRDLYAMLEIHRVTLELAVEIPRQSYLCPLEEIRVCPVPATSHSELHCEGIHWQLYYKAG